MAYLARISLFSVTALAGTIPPFDYSNPFGLYGRTPNTTCSGAGSGGICGATATINSFVYLQKFRPNIYGKKLVPDVDTNGVASTSRDQFADTGWRVNGHARREGLYRRAEFLTSPYSTFLSTKIEWIEDRVPAQTIYEWRFHDPSTGTGGRPDIAWLADQISAKQDVEFVVEDGGFAHMLTLTGVKCEVPNYMFCSLTFQDPNDPTTRVTDHVIVSRNGIFVDTGSGSGYITAAFAESPVPEPITILLTGAGLIVVFTIRGGAHRTPSCPRSSAAATRGAGGLSSELRVPISETRLRVRRSGP